MSIDAAMRDACAAVEIVPPARPQPGRWVQCPVVGKRKSNGSGRVLIFDDERGGLVWNWATGQQQRFTVEGPAGANEVRAPRPDPEKERRLARERQQIEQTCQGIVRACRQEPHPYLAAKGFPAERGLVLDDPREHMPEGDLGWRMKAAVPAGEGPFLIVPGRIGRSVATVQFITAEGVKKNILGGQMGGASHRIATGREAWVSEGIATALSVRAALRLLGRSATVLSAFSAQNVSAVAGGISGAIIAADNDRPIEMLGGLGTGEYWARKSGCRWVQPPALGDWNDYHAEHGLRAVAIALREAPG